jgi:spore germination protein YaaH
MKKFYTLFLFAAFLLPLSASAATTSSFEVTGWIPYWRAATGTADVLPHLSELTEVNPFVYSLKSDGTILDNGGMDKEPWTSFIAAAKAQKVRVIPTIMSGDGDLEHSLLSNTTSRVALEDRIAALVNANSYDGIDIDFEGKHAEDKDFFSTFLKGLSQRLGSKFLMCTIESRTPVDARYYGSEVPPDAQIYANDFAAINQYCSRVRLMTYDQQGIDQALAASAASSSQLYAPVADPVWVRKVVQLAEKTIDPNKLLIGVPTYGYGYDVTAYAGNEYSYKILWTFNPGFAWPIANQLGITPQRNSAGELFFTYNADENGNPIPPTLTGPNNAMLVAAAASSFAQANNSHPTFQLLDWPDAQSIAGKAEEAQILGVRGISIFKFDGGEDPGIWTALLGVKGGDANTSSGASSASPAGTAPIVRTLTAGSVGNDVRTLQIILNSDTSTRIAASGAGSPGQETTRYGALTRAAVLKFQAKYGISQTGSVGPITGAKLNTILSSL